MSQDGKVGLIAVGLVVVCCAGPLVLSVLASGAVLGALGALHGSAPLLVVAAAILGAVGVLLVRRRRSSGSEGRCPAPSRSAEASATSPRGGGC